MDRLAQRRARLQEIERLTSGSSRRMSLNNTRSGRSSSGSSNGKGGVNYQQSSRNANHRTGSRGNIEDIDRRVQRRIEVCSRLGRGAYGIVWKGIERRSTYPKRIVALKKCFNAFASSSDAQRTYREISYLRILAYHVNIIQLRKVIRPKNDLDIYLIFEFMDTDLHVLIRARLLQDVHKKYVTYQLLKALKYMHSAHIVHRDIKPSNILLDENGHMKLCDLGLCRSVSSARDHLHVDHDTGHEESEEIEDSDRRHFSQMSNNNVFDLEEKKTIFLDASTTSDRQREYYVATRWYRAPESLLGSTVCLPGLDIWAVACIIGEMYHGSPVLPGESTADQIYRILDLVRHLPPRGDDRTDTPIDLMTHLRHLILADARTLENTNASEDDSRQGNELHLADWFLSHDGGEEARPLCTSMLRLDACKRVTAAEALKDAWLDLFCGCEPEPEYTGDIPVRLAVSDDTLLTAAEYREHIFRDLLHYKTKSRTGGRSLSGGSGAPHPFIETHALPEDDDDDCHEFNSNIAEPPSATTVSSDLFAPMSGQDPETVADTISAFPPESSPHAGEGDDLASSLNFDTVRPAPALQSVSNSSSLTSADGSGGVVGGDPGPDVTAVTEGASEKEGTPARFSTFS